MSLADFMLPQVSSESVSLVELSRAAAPSPLFAGYDPLHQELLLSGELKPGVEELTMENLTTRYKPHRNFQFIDSLPSVPRRSILWDMEDARAFDSRVYTGRDLNVFQYNRRAGSRHAVLWGLRNYFEPTIAIGHAGRVEDGLKFEDKMPVVFWRGALTGSRWVSPFARVGPGAVESIAEFESSADHFSRVKAALIARSSHIMNVKLTVHPRMLDSKPWLADLGILDGQVSPAEQLENKYILCLNGNDVASNLYWVLSTQSIAFKENSTYEVLPDYFLKPWVHFVPIVSGLSDLQEKMDYCEANPDLCKRIVDNANLAYLQMIDPETWRSAELEVLERLSLL